MDRVKQSNETMTQYYLGKMDLLQVCDVNDREADSHLIDGLMGHTLRNGAKPELLCMGLSIVYRQTRRFCCWAGDENKF
jgi:hypothetical protein